MLHLRQNGAANKLHANTVLVLRDANSPKVIDGSASTGEYAKLTRNGLNW